MQRSTIFRRIERVERSKLIQTNSTEPDVELNFYELNSPSLVRLTKSSTFGQGLTWYNWTLLGSIRRKSDLFNHEYDFRPNWTTQVPLPINHNFNKICDIKGSFILNQNIRNSKIFFANSKKKSHLSASDMTRTVLNCPIKLKSGQLITN